MKINSFKITAGYALICLLWGSTWLAIKIGLESFTPIFSAGIRFFLAAAIIIVILKLKKIKISTDPAAKKIYLLMAFLSFAFPFSLVYWAEERIPSALASILFASYPFFVALSSRIMIPQEKVGFFKIIGIALGFIGIIIIFSEKLFIEFEGYVLGMAAVLLSAALQSIVAVSIKKSGSHLHPLAMNFYPLLISGVFLIAASLVLENFSRQTFEVVGIATIIYLAVFGTIITFSTYYWLLKRINVVILSLSAFITPMVATALGIFFAGEIYSSKVFIGASLVLFGILFANFKGIKNYYLLNKLKQINVKSYKD